MRRPSDPSNPNRQITCYAEGLVFRGPTHVVIANLEEHADKAGKENDIAKMHNFYQHAEHYKRIINGEAI